LKNSVLIICGSKVWHKNTCAVLISSDINVVGICEVDQNNFGIPIKYILGKIRKDGIVKVLDQIFCKVYYNYLNKAKDNHIKKKIFNRKSIELTLSSWSGAIHKTNNILKKETIDWIKKIGPDIIVVHCGYIIPKKVLKIPKKKIIIGGHPGLIPNYRGSHSAFWAIYKQKPKDVGCSVFFISNRIDGGDIISQDKINVDPNDSYVTIGWKGMKKQAILQAKVISDFDNGIEIPRTKINIIPSNSYYDLPRLKEYLYYQQIQSTIR
jgi:folate-dependent phosphoribosylglycinamide formyltransferase PurN